MVLYTYQAIDGRGRRVCGHRFVSGQEEITKYLNHQGFTECRIYQSKTAYSRTPYKFVKPRELSVFFRRMGAVFTAERDELKALSFLTDQQENRQLRLALKEIYDIALKGFSVVEGLSMYSHLLTEFAVNMIKAAVECDAFIPTLYDISDYFLEDAKRRANLTAAMFYPIISFGLTAVLCLFILGGVFPTFRGAAESLNAVSLLNAAPVTVAKPTLSLAFTETVIRVVLGGTAAALFLGLAVYAFAKTRRGGYLIDKMQAESPITRNEVCKTAAARYLRSVALLMKNAPFTDAIDGGRLNVSNKYLSEKLAAVARRIRQETVLEKALDELEPLPPILGRTIYAGFAAGASLDLFNHAAKTLEDEAEEAADRLSRFVEPALAVLAGVVMCAVLASIILPMMNVLNNI